MAEIRAREDIECPGGMLAFLAYPKAAGRYPVVILMHERYGLVAHTKDLARRCAADGYVVMAPNFFFKHPDQKVLNAGDSRYDMTDPESVELIKDYQNRHPGPSDIVAVAEVADQDQDVTDDDDGQQHD